MSPYNIIPKLHMKVRRTDLLIVKQTLPVSTLGNVGKKLWKICILLLGFSGLTVYKWL